MQDNDSLGSEDHDDHGLDYHEHGAMRSRGGWKGMQRNLGRSAQVRARLECPGEDSMV